MAISNNSIQQLLPIVRPYLRNESERRAYLMRALGTNADALNLIWNEPVNTFIPNMVQTLVAFGELTPGKLALCALLEVIREDMGVDVKVKINELLQQIREELSPKENQVPQWYRKAVAQYFYVTLQRLKEQGCLNIRKDVVDADRRLNYAAKITDFELPFAVMNMRGEAFFLFSEFSEINMKTLQQFSAQCMKWAKKQVAPSGVGQALYNFRIPTHLCLAIALVDRVEQKTATEVQTTNPLDHKTDALWYEIPIIYELSQKKLYFYDQPSSFWENFKGEVVWKKLRAVIQEVASGKPLLPILRPHLRNESGLCALLEVIRQDVGEDVGEDVKVQIDKLLQQVRKKLNPRENQFPQWYRQAVTQHVEDKPVKSGKKAMPNMSSLERNQIFISYSHMDKDWLEKLQTMLKPLMRNKTINVWDDTRIKAGAKWREEITKALAAAKVAVLMVSPNFLASEFINQEELPHLLKAAEEERLTIIWVHVSYCLYEESEIGDYQAAHDTSKPLDTLSSGELNQVLREIVQKIKVATT